MQEPRKPANRGDMRWQRTERHLLAALACQLDKLPLDKVKVTEVCRVAEVSKATFYLHYRDVYDLADAFVDARVERVLDELGDPTLPLRDLPTFVERFVKAFSSEEQERFMELADENRLAPLFLDRFIRALGQRLNEQAPPSDERGSKVALSFIVGGLAIAVQSHCDVEPRCLTAMLTELMSATLERAPQKFL